MKISSRIQLKIFELSTGRFNWEEWSISLEDWNGAQHPTPIDHQGDLLIQTCQDVALVNNKREGNYGRRQKVDASDLLVINLVTRNKFYIRRAIIANEIREKTGRYINLNNYQILHTYGIYMYDKNDQVFIKFEIDESYYTHRKIG